MGALLFDGRASTTVIVASTVSHEPLTISNDSSTVVKALGSFDTEALTVVNVTLTISKIGQGRNSLAVLAKPHVIDYRQ